MFNLFDGVNGHSNGKEDGGSQTFNVSGPYNLHCFGTFDGAKVTLQRYSNTLSDFVDTDAIWTCNAQFQALFITPHSEYRLNLTGASTNTEIIAERA